MRAPVLVSGGEHLEELRADPIALLRRVRAECGDVGRFDLAGRPVILLTGGPANEWFFRAPDEDLDQAEAYPFMTPIFGQGVVFDATPEQRREALHNQALRGSMMRGHAAVIADEVVGFWKQVADGGRYQVAGIGGSWFRYGGDWQWSWQRDFFDLGNATALFIEMFKAGDLSDGMRRRMERAATGAAQPGHHRIGEGPVALW